MQDVEDELAALRAKLREAEAAKEKAEQRATQAEVVQAVAVQAALISLCAQERSRRPQASEEEESPDGSESGAPAGSSPQVDDDNVIRCVSRGCVRAWVTFLAQARAYVSGAQGATNMYHHGCQGRLSVHGAPCGGLSECMACSDPRSGIARARWHCMLAHSC